MGSFEFRSCQLETEFNSVYYILVGSSCLCMSQIYLADKIVVRLGHLALIFLSETLLV